MRSFFLDGLQYAARHLSSKLPFAVFRCPSLPFLPLLMTLCDSEVALFFV